EVVRVLHAADAAGDHQGAESLGVRQRIVERDDPAGRRAHQVEAVEAEQLGQGVQVVAGVAGLLPSRVRSRAAPVPPVVGDAAEAGRGERRELYTQLSAVPDAACSRTTAGP